MASLSLTPATLAMLLVGCALISSLITLSVVGLAVKYRLWPALERHIDHRLEQAADRLEERLRRRVSGLAKDLARGVGGLVVGRRGREDDADPDA
ncbi:hypothetical protein B5T_01788 [Alloalcanivorax dieselolei B5]|uniref:Uncharacterized protein n=1 Tax=Alcanivorax dieselolei (strain DSM 16502 / CGMCC 1.3690 / MCCC 1A00001 / B-5) TaxID=930169 RepID=K0CC33_ALCDB|nr:hypothetical protein [Alloalcanivorax dieselolei]AFT70065.1 hypothetical protein B5T_01788 [Alloalcanivorax dieselolei B5]GGJ96809.1 hypothetical protein GCM10007426_27340 [Alloalcanivorax dieselolei]